VQEAPPSAIAKLRLGVDLHRTRTLSRPGEPECCYEP
jgi:hypothetical protein